MPMAPGSRTRDAALAAGVAVIVVGGTVLPMPFGGAGGSPGVLGWTLLLTGCGLLALRGRYPVAVAVGTFVACALYYPLVTADGPLLLTFVVSLYTVAARGHLVSAGALATAALLATGYGEAVGDVRNVDDVALVMLAGWLVAVVALGGARHTRHAYLREVEQRAATEERLHIARELHDVLGHNLSLINVQAGAALHRIQQDPGQAERALDVIKESSRQTLRELRTTLGVLRQADADGPGLARLDELIEQVRASGLSVRTEVAGERRPLSPDADLTAYRVVQEALTNVRRHAGASSATVHIRYGRDEVRVEVDDDGRGAPERPAGAGHGIRGLGERVGALGGELTAGRHDGGGFRVSVRLPQGVSA
ncbi:sensor histidine kinase [Qaidamihabitans albus]|uniref:sensor histidine kinase n=1 Tax=Qaidamihabitans albus TaxID=2795733 RepID=UPI0018F15D7B|nr:sensor histidine kinase [Qaidamihabitans albus]